jgi:hypothetical protein
MYTRVVLVLVLVMVASTVTWAATWTGGMLYSRFGVTLETEEYDMDPGSGTALINRFINSWTPSADPNAAAGVERAFVVDDFYGYPNSTALNLDDTYTYEGGQTDGNTSNEPASYTKPAGGEVFDTEAIYMTNDERALYIAIITSTPPPPGVPTPFGTVMTGDLAIHTQSDPLVHSGEYAYGLNLNMADTGEDAYDDTEDTIGTGLYKTDYDGPGDLDDDWYVGNLSLSATAGNEETNFYLLRPGPEPQQVRRGQRQWDRGEVPEHRAAGRLRDRHHRPVRLHLGSQHYHPVGAAAGVPEPGVWGEPNDRRLVHSRVPQ